MPPQSHPEGTHQVRRAAHADPSLAPAHPNKRGQAPHISPAGNPETQVAGGMEELIDLRGHVEACHHKSLHTPISCARSGNHPVT